MPVSIPEAGQWWVYRRPDGVGVRVLLLKPGRVSGWVVQLPVEEQRWVSLNDLIAETLDPDE